MSKKKEKAKFKYFKKYKDVGSEWEEVTFDNILELLRSHYKIVTLTLDYLHDGHVVGTTFSILKAEPIKEEKAIKP